MAAYGIELGIDYATALKIGSALGGGMGKTGQTCGVVTGALMLIGLSMGTADENDKDSKENVYRLAGEFIKEFETVHTSAQCRDLLGFDINDNSYPDKSKIISARCPGYIKTAAGILDKLLRGSHV